jgi:hypothetical protein
LILSLRSSQVGGGVLPNNRERLFFIGSLRALAVYMRTNPGWRVHNAHGSLSFIYILPARAAERATVISKIISGISISEIFSSTGKTSTSTNEVWRLALALNGEMRTRRCTPYSFLSVPYALLPFDLYREIAVAAVVVLILVQYFYSSSRASR